MFFGCKMSKHVGSETYLGVIRSCLRKVENGTEQHHWNVYYPFYKDSLDGDNETLPLDDIAHGLIDAYESGTGGLFIDHDSQKIRKSSWHPTCKCNLNAKRLISGPTATNSNEPFYVCPSNACDYYRFEKHIARFM